MFTGIIEQIGTVTAVSDQAGARRVTIRATDLEDLPLGASIAVNGVCLTVVGHGDSAVSMDVVPETVDRTNLGELSPASQVNLERPMPAAGRFDGHIVQGHVDGTGTVVSLVDESESAVMEVETDPDLLRYVVEKGSITVDGVSLTVAGLTDHGFSVALIPHTLEVTTLGLRKEGDNVNLEVDVLAKYVERLMRGSQ